MKLFALAMFATAAMSVATPGSGDIESLVERDDSDVGSELIPGEGLPSLESLGLTTADLEDPDFASKHGLEDDDEELEAYEAQFDTFTTAASARFPNQCRPRYFVPTPLRGIRSCRNYLRKLGNTMCRLGGELPGVPGTAQTTFCHHGIAHIYGHGKPRTASYCKHVARGVTWGLKNCVKNKKVASLAAAYGNGDLQVAAQKWN